MSNDAEDFDVEADYGVPEEKIDALVDPAMDRVRARVAAMRQPHTLADGDRIMASHRAPPGTLDWQALAADIRNPAIGAVEVLGRALAIALDYADKDILLPSDQGAIAYARRVLDAYKAGTLGDIVAEQNAVERRE